MRIFMKLVSRWQFYDLSGKYIAFNYVQRHGSSYTLVLERARKKAIFSFAFSNMHWSFTIYRRYMKRRCVSVMWNTRLDLKKLHLISQKPQQIAKFFMHFLTCKFIILKINSQEPMPASGHAKPLALCT